MKIPLQIAFATLLLFAVAPRADAQALDGAWFKVAINFKGAAVAPAGPAEKAAGKITVYMLVSAAPAADADIGVLYDYEIWSEVSPDTFMQTATGQFVTRGASEEVMTGPDNEGVTFGVAVPDEDSSVLTVSFIASTKIKLDGKSALSKASFKSFGAIVPTGLSDPFGLFGGAKVKGSTITADKLPFTPEM